MLALLYFAQERLIFPSTKLPADHAFRFGQQRFAEVRIPVPGATLHALHFTQPEPRGLVFFLHGNAGNLQTWTTGVDFYRHVNYDLFILDYRGYGKSTGTIDGEDQLHADVRAAWDAIAPRYRDLPIVIYGRSLGTGLAARLARDVPPALLVLVTPYSSLAAAARRAFPMAPDFLLKYRLRTDTLIGDVRQSGPPHARQSRHADSAHGPRGAARARARARGTAGGRGRGTQTTSTRSRRISNPWPPGCASWDATDPHGPGYWPPGFSGGSKDIAARDPPSPHSSRRTF